MYLTYTPPLTPWLDTLYADEHLLVINKPSGLLSVPGRLPSHQDSVMTRVWQEHAEAQAVHRLDMSTSGIMLVALHKEAERALKRQFELRRTRKHYLARVWGALRQPQGKVDLPLICDWPRRPRQKVCFVCGKPSQTHYELLQQDADSSLLRLTPITGRSHQLRVHLQSLGNPILGDEFYAHPQAFAAAPRLLLHAAGLGFQHPVSGEDMDILCPADFA